MAAGIGCASRGGCGSTRGPTIRGTRGSPTRDRSSANCSGGTSSRGAVDPHGALAVLERVVHAVHEVPGHRAPVDGAADPRGPPPGGVPLVVAGGVIDEAVVAVQLERLAAGRQRCRARARARCLCVHTYERPCGETTSTPAGAVSARSSTAAARGRARPPPRRPSRPRTASRPAARRPTSAAGCRPRAHRPRTASRRAGRRRRSVHRFSGRPARIGAMRSGGRRRASWETSGPRTGSSRMTCQYTPD